VAKVIGAWSVAFGFTGKDQLFSRKDRKREPRIARLLLLLLLLSALHSNYSATLLPKPF